jgi:hypothetical protein
MAARALHFPAIRSRACRGLPGWPRWRRLPRPGGARRRGSPASGDQTSPGGPRRPAPARNAVRRARTRPRRRPGSPHRTGWRAPRSGPPPAAAPHSGMRPACARRGAQALCRALMRSTASRLGSCGTRTSRASGWRARTVPKASSRQSSSTGQVEPATRVGILWPSARSGSLAGTAATRASTLSQRGSPVTLIRSRGTPRVTSRSASSSLMAPAIASARYPGASSARARAPRRPLPGRTVAATSATGTSRAGCLGGELRPDIELGKDEQGRPQRVERLADGIAACRSAGSRRCRRRHRRQTLPRRD